ncbi:transcription termination/antitermination protein NusG [Prosthecomicrobium sp. N25]|uniref:transcription termination/antitermination protein NusG n=1 Tax=Prosthecomicrobium sp. N25 TaxID=3129254 RepID=UPI003076E256
MSGETEDGRPAAPGVALGTTRWYVAATLPHKEAVAEVNLARQGFRTFLPRITATRRHARRFEQIRAPLFPRYVFVELDTGRQRWRSVNGTIGVTSLIMEGEGPKPVLGGVVESLIASADDGGLIRFRSGLQEGDRVRLVSGPFADALGVLQSLDGKGRVKLLLDVLNGGFRVTSTLDALIPA